MRRRKIDTDRDSSPALARRLQELCDLHWDGNKTSMGRACGGIDQPTMSRTLSGQQQAPMALLAALAVREDVNVRWLLTGHGFPYPPSRDLEFAGGQFRPIARKLLPGNPSDYPELLTETSLPIATAFYTPTVYWYQVPKGVDITKANLLKVRAGDYLLIETSTNWTRREKGFDDRLCVFAENELDECWFALVEDSVIDVFKQRSLKLFSGNRQRREFRLDLDRPQIPENGNPEIDEPDMLYRNELVGVCRLMHRPDLNPNI